MEIEKRDLSANFRTSTKKLHGIVSRGGFIRTNSQFGFADSLAGGRIFIEVHLLAMIQIQAF